MARRALRMRALYLYRGYHAVSMTLGARLVCVASVILVLTLAVRANDQAPSPPASAKASAGQASPTSDYLGSASCAHCHDVQHQQWRNSLHIKMTKPIADATIAGDFTDGTRFSDHDRSYTLGMK